VREARFLPPSRRWLLRVLPLLGLVVTGWGCQQPPHYFYYGYGSPGCVPVVPAPAPTVNGKAGEPPTEVIEGGMTSAGSPGRTTTVVGSETTVIGSEKSPRVVVSETDSRPRPSWRRNPDPEQTAATVNIEGAISSSNSSDSSVNR
jgi:hypothetical protein